MFVNGIHIQMEISESTLPVISFKYLECRDILELEEGVMPGSLIGSVIGMDIDMNSPPWGFFELRDIDIRTKRISKPDRFDMNLDFELKDLLLESIPALGKNCCTPIYARL